jgi:hypothetical protein
MSDLRLLLSVLSFGLAELRSAGVATLAFARSLPWSWK